MADIYFSGRTGKTITAQLYADGAAFGPVIPMTEITGTGEYLGNLPSLTPAGKYLVVFFAGQVKYGSGTMEWDGSKEISLATQASVLIQIQTRVDSELARLRT